MESGNKLPYGYRGKLGLIVVGPNPTPRPDISRMTPDGVLVLETRIDMEPRVELDVISQLSLQLPQAANLLSQAKVDAIAIACTAGTISGGPGHDKREIAEMEAKSNGIPCTTVATACHNAMKFMGIKRIVLASPYVPPINEDFRVYFNATGFEVLNIECLAITNSYELASVPPYKVYNLGKRALVDGADAIFIPCTTFPAIDVIEDLEKDTGKPVITSNQALAWEMMRMIGINEPVHGFGRLLAREDRCSYVPKD
ncbi:MAG TPA: Asp/Glu racemase [Firmicutes bacterium]|nr:Asp/Glu racemase [Bacillota bacterium]